MRSVMSSTRMMRPTASKLRETSGAMAMLAMRDLAGRAVRGGTCRGCGCPARLATRSKRVDELRREDGGERLAQNLGARLGVHDFHLRVPALDAVVEVDGEDADVDGLDDVLVELLEAFELGDLLFEAAVELGVLNGDADVAGEGFEQLHVFAGEEVAIVGAAEADDGDGAGAAALAIGDAAGQVVVEIERGRRCCAAASGRRRTCCGFSRKIWLLAPGGRSRGSGRRGCGARAAVQVGEAVGGGEIEVSAG